MKDLVLDPLVLSLVVVGALASFVIIYYLNRERVVASIFKKIIVYLFLFIVSGVGVFPFSHLNIASLRSHEKGLLSGILLLSVYIAVFILLRVRISQILTNIIVLFQQNYLSIYLSLIIFSTFWSRTPLFTFRAAITLTIISCFAVYFARGYSWQEIFKLLRWNQIIIAFFSTFMSIFFPALAQTEKGWGGAIGHPIDLGNMMALTASLWLLNALENPRYRLRSLVFAGFSVIVMQFANSAGAFIAFLSLIAIIFIYPLFRKLNFFQAYILFTLIFLIFALPMLWLITNLDVALSLFNKDLSFTGRVPLWNYLIEEKIKDHLWFGYGYSGFWQPWQGSNNPSASVNHLIGEWAIHAHNGILEIILNVGLIGFIVFALSFIVNISRTIKLIVSTPSPALILPLIILMYVFVSSIFHHAIILPSYIWFIYVLATVKLQIHTNKKHQNFNKRILVTPNLLNNSLGKQPSNI